MPTPAVTLQFPLHIAVLDTETTGLSARTDRMVEVAVLLLRVDHEARLLEQVDAYQSLHDPGVPIPTYATAVHGITDAMVRGHRIDAERLGGILRRADLVVAHNTGFDKGFVRQLLPEVDAMTWGCSCRGIPWKRMYPHLYSISLTNLALGLRIQAGQAHRALGDVETTVRLLLRDGPSGLPHLHQLVAKKAKAIALARGADSTAIV
jgi:DNA polymerase-3 subunit epsilon